MKKLIVILAILLLPGTTAYCEQAKQPTKAELEAALKNVQTEKRYLELQVQEANIQQALKNLEKPAEPAKKPEVKK